MPIESLILRRCYPVPVTFADLRQAVTSTLFNERRSVNTMDAWHAAIKESTGAVDEVYAVIDGREVRVATVGQKTIMETVMLSDGPAIDHALGDLLIKADEAGYWQRPHEIVHVLSERPVSLAVVERAVNVGWTAKGGAA